MNLNLFKRPSDLPVQFWIVAFVGFINAVSFTLIIPIIYPYAQQFQLNDFEASLLITSFAICQFIGTPILGKLSDRFGRKPLLILSLFGTVLANLIASLSTVAWLLYAARMLDGFTGGNNSIAKAVISDITDSSQRAKAFGIFDAVFRFGFIIGPGLNYIAQQLPTFPGISSLGMCFLLAAAIAFFGTLMAIFFLPETLSVTQEVDLDWQDFVFIRIFQAAVRPKLGNIFILTLFSGFTFTIFTFAFQPFVIRILKQDPETLPLIFVSIGILGFASQIFSFQPLTKNFNLIDVLFVALLIRGIVFFLIPTFPYLNIFAVLIVIFALVNPFPLPILSAIVSLNSSKREQGEILGINASYLSMANALGPAFSGVIISYFGYQSPFWITGVLTVITALFALTLKSDFKCKKAAAK